MILSVSRIVLAMAMAVLLAACSAHSAKSQAPAVKHAHASEPYPLRLVDRSRFAPHLWPATVTSPFKEKPGTIVVDTQNHHLYLMLEEGMARRYGIAVGESGKAWSGRASIGRKATWPAWYPTDEMRRTTRELPTRIEPGPANPLGARALYLYAGGNDTLYRIHGTSEPWTIGTNASSGCIRMLNEDVIELYAQVGAGAQVLVI